MLTCHTKVGKPIVMYNIMRFNLCVLRNPAWISMNKMPTWISWFTVVTFKLTTFSTAVEEERMLVMLINFSVASSWCPIISEGIPAYGATHLKETKQLKSNATALLFTRVLQSKDYPNEIAKHPDKESTLWQHMIKPYWLCYKNATK